MKAAEATDSLRVSAKPARSLACSARDLPPHDKNMERGRESQTLPSCPGRTAAKLHNSRALADTCNKKAPPSAVASVLPPTSSETLANRRDQVLCNLMQTGGVKARCSAAATLAGAGAMANRRRCSCGEPNYVSNGNVAPNSSVFQSGHGSCNCNVENCAWEERLTSAASLKSGQWRSSSDQTNTNAALHRALASMKKISGEPNAVKKMQPKPPISSCPATELHFCEAPDGNASSITNPDARTLSMRERGRWGNSKMQQQHFAQPACGTTSLGGTQNVKGNPGVEHQHLQQHQTLQHMRCLNCGSFSTTPVMGIGQAARSHSFGRKMRDFSWQQELQQEQRRPEPQGINKQAVRGNVQLVPPQSAALQDAAAHNRCRCTEIAEPYPDSEQFHGQLHMGLKHFHGSTVMSWQERYMLLCQAIAAGAFVDGGPDDMSGPMFPSNRGYSWAVCECAACETSCGMAEPMSFRQGQSNYCNTTTGERMMELEAFSGPIGYVSECKAGAEVSRIMEKRSSAGGRRRWWARLPSFGKSKSNSLMHAGAAASGSETGSQTTSHCSSCGQRVGMKGEEEISRRLCLDCVAKARIDKCDSGPLPAAAAAPRAAPPPRAAWSHPPPLFSRHQKHLPRRWRLMKLCRYLMGFPLHR